MTGMIQGRSHLEHARYEIDVARLVPQQIAGSEEDAHRLTEILAKIRETGDLLSRVRGLSDPPGRTGPATPRAGSPDATRGSRR
jgi:hypothetical protein